ncbi:hypothetical protein [Nocardia sp. NPDC051833]|uniref:hypothetical protein n=1 Tax=Nocardia sp. NPDC051833 TaxID=3155674 RepID=UPI00344536D2
MITMIGPTEVNFTDLLLLTFLRVQYPSLYDALRGWKRDLNRDLTSLIFSSRTLDKRTVTSTINESANQNTSTDTSASRCLSTTSATLQFSMDCLQLAEHGEMPATSELSVAFSDLRRRVAFEKPRIPIYGVRFTSATAFQGAINLARRFNLHSHPQPTWSLEMSMVADLLDIATISASTETDYKSIIDSYNQNFGLNATAMVVACVSRRPSGNRGSDDRRLAIYEAALTNHRERQLEACKNDFDTGPTNPSTGDVLFHLLDDPTRARLNAIVEPRISDWPGFLEVADRFLDTSAVDVNGQPSVHGFYIESLCKFIAPDRWPTPTPDPQLGEGHPGGPIVRTDITYSNRARLIDMELRRRLDL